MLLKIAQPRHINHDEQSTLVRDTGARITDPELGFRQKNGKPMLFQVDQRYHYSVPTVIKSILL